MKGKLYIHWTTADIVALQCCDLYLPSSHLIFTQLPLENIFIPLLFCFVLPASLFLLSLSASKAWKHTHTHTCLDTQPPVFKGFISGAASVFYQQSPENPIRLIWQSKENQTAPQYTKEARAAGWSTIHSLWLSLTAARWRQLYQERLR